MRPFTRAPTGPLYQQLYAHLQAAILAGELAGGSRLPSTRALADELHVSRNTVLAAYAQLAAEGYLTSVEGSGSFVARGLPDQSPAPPRRAPRKPTQPAPKTHFSDQARRQLAAPRMSEAAPRAVSRPFNFGSPDLSAFPHGLWSRLVVRQARRLPANSLGYQEPAGYRPLREAIAAHTTLSRRIHCTPEQIVMVSGSQGALDLAARMLLNPGEAVWVEDPGYLGARGAFLGAGARLVPVPVDREGLVVEAGVRAAPEARLVYITPSHQFPLGVTLSLPRRLALLAWAERANAYILEDDYDSEYRFAGRPLPALQGLDEAGRVIYIGTFSKVLFPALRLGYLVLPTSLLEPFLSVRSLVDTHMPLLEQRVLADFIAEGHFARHLRRMRTLYGERQAALLKALTPLPLEVESPEAGLHCIGWLTDGMDDRAVAARAAAMDISLAPVSRFSLGPATRPGVVVGYAEFAPRLLREAARRLAAVLESK